MSVSTELLRLRGDHSGLPGHNFGLKLPPAEKEVLVAFLKTL
jgi:hypothetical protein